MGCLPANPRPSNLTSSTCGGTNCAPDAHPPDARQRKKKQKLQMKVRLFQKEERRRDHSRSGNL